MNRHAAHLNSFGLPFARPVSRGLLYFLLCFIQTRSHLGHFVRLLDCVLPWPLAAPPPPAIEPLVCACTSPFLPRLLCEGTTALRLADDLASFYRSVHAFVFLISKIHRLHFQVSMSGQEPQDHGSSRSAASTNNNLRALAQVGPAMLFPLFSFHGRGKTFSL